MSADVLPADRLPLRSRARAARTRLVAPSWSPLLVLAAFVAVVAELAWLGWGVSVGTGPTMPVLPSAVAVPLVLLVAARAWPRPDRAAWAPTWVVLAVAGTAAGVAGVASTGLAETVELAAASVAEEVVFRVAVPVALAAVLRALWVPSRTALAAGVVLSVAAFTALPGHLAQVAAHGPGLLVSFAGMAALWSLVVWTTGTVWPAAAAHAVVNVALLPVEAGAWPAHARSVLVATVLLALVWGTHRAQVVARTRHVDPCA